MQRQQTQPAFIHLPQICTSLVKRCAVPNGAREDKKIPSLTDTRGDEKLSELQTAVWSGAVSKQAGNPEAHKVRKVSESTMRARTRTLHREKKSGVCKRLLGLEWRKKEEGAIECKNIDNIYRVLKTHPYTHHIVIHIKKIQRKTNLKQTKYKNYFFIKRKTLCI